MKGRPDMKKTLCILLAGMLAVCACGCGKDDTSDKEITIPILETKEDEYTVAKAEVGTISSTFQLSANYDYPYTEPLFFKMNGSVKKVMFDPAASVKKGDVLFQLDTAEIDEEIKNQQIRLDSAEETLKNVKSRGASQNEIEYAQLSYDIEQNAMDMLMAKKEEYTVVAPSDGMVNLQFMDVTEFREHPEVYAGEYIGVMKDGSRKEICAVRYGEPLDNVAFGTKVELTQGSNTASGTVADIVYNDNGEYSNYVYILKPDDENVEFLDFGEIDVRFKVYRKDNTVLVPSSAVTQVGDRTFVYELIDGIRIETDVEIGIVDELAGKTEIISGLQGGEDIVA